MASVISRAATGQRNALWSLYDHSKKSVYYLALQLLQDDEQARQATAQVFHMQWARLVSGEISVKDDKAWDALMLESIIAECKKRITRHDSKAFRIPTDRRFLADASPADSGDALAVIFGRFSDLQRFVLVLHTVTAMSEDELAAAVKLDRRTLQVALADERENIARLGFSYDAVCRQLTDGAAAVRIPAELDDAAAGSIHTLSAKYEKEHRRKTLTVVGCVLACCVVLCALSAALIWQLTSDGPYTSTSGDGGTTTTTTAVSDEAVDKALANKGTVTTVETPTHYATIDIAQYGTVKVALDGNTAPETVENFVSLAESGFYDGLTFHRIVEDFMMQGGDPNGNGSGGSDENVVGEFAQNGFDNPLSHVRGAISMARSSVYDSGSSQFFIVHEDATYLDGEYAAFGYVVEGMEVVDAVCEAAEPTDGNGTISADAQPVINSITIENV